MKHLIEVVLHDDGGLTMTAYDPDVCSIADVLYRLRPMVREMEIAFRQAEPRMKPVPIETFSLRHLAEALVWFNNLVDDGQYDAPKTAFDLAIMLAHEYQQNLSAILIAPNRDEIIENVLRHYSQQN